jgi:hypothetical protein
MLSSQVVLLAATAHVSGLILFCKADALLSVERVVQGGEVGKLIVALQPLKSLPSRRV